MVVHLGYPFLPQERNLYIYKAEKPSVRLSVCLTVCHVDNSPGTASFDSSGAYYEALIIFLLQVCYCEFTRASVRSAKRAEGKGVEKI